MKAERLIGKVVKKDLLCNYIAVAEGMEWDMFSSNDVKVGDFVVCNVFNEGMEDCFYLEDARLPASNKEEWKKQEENLK